ncbi:MAG: response regulator [Methylocystis sp.]|jgi:two-component system chemotaxis response regulator CheY|nr:response regulator [Methylocystis sp.]MCA3583537.1 response regulator [Methylocystis sp.]MCA3589680.1 response regulator [Methylocystis sp.]MCA3592331.1 response regulator [Methylocystis sp.]
MFSVECSRLRFLIVDDNNHMRRIIRALLHGFGIREAYEAEDGAAGLEAFSSYSPDIVITDWAMPIFDGIELTRMIRQPETSSNPYVPIIMVTGHAERRRVSEARDAGVTEFLVKPISAKALHQRIVSVVMIPRPFIKTATYFGPCRRRTPNPSYTGIERRGKGLAEKIDPVRIGDAMRLDR